jgi:hypothetical protein
MGATHSKKVNSKKSNSELEVERMFKSLNESVNIKYNSRALRNIFLEDGATIFTNEEIKDFMKNYVETIDHINTIVDREYFDYENNGVRELYINFLVACHYGYKELAEYLLRKYRISIFIMQIAFIHCIRTENIKICEWLFSFKSVDYRQFYENSISTYYELFKWCCINGKLTSAKWMYEQYVLRMKI